MQKSADIGKLCLHYTVTTSGVWSLLDKQTQDHNNNHKSIDILLYISNSN